MNKGVYNLYDNGELVLENVYAGDIKDYIGTDKISVANYVEHGFTYDGRYTMEKGDPDLAHPQFVKEWNEAVAPFRRVQWVKSGGRKLGGH